MEQNETDFSDDTAGLTDSQIAALPYLVASPTLSEGIDQGRSNERPYFWRVIW